MPRIKFLYPYRETSPQAQKVADGYHQQQQSQPQQQAQPQQDQQDQQQTLPVQASLPESEVLTGVVHHRRRHGKHNHQRRREEKSVGNDEKEPSSDDENITISKKEYRKMQKQYKKMKKIAQKLELTSPSSETDDISDDSENEQKTRDHRYYRSRYRHRCRHPQQFAHIPPIEATDDTTPRSFPQHCGSGDSWDVRKWGGHRHQAEQLHPHPPHHFRPHFGHHRQHHPLHSVQEMFDGMFQAFQPIIASMTAQLGFPGTSSQSLGEVSSADQPQKEPEQQPTQPEPTTSEQPQPSECQRPHHLRKWTEERPREECPHHLRKWTEERPREECPHHLRKWNEERPHRIRNWNEERPHRIRNWNEERPHRIRNWNEERPHRFRNWNEERPHRIREWLKGHPRRIHRWRHHHNDFITPDDEIIEAMIAEMILMQGDQPSPDVDETEADEVFLSTKTNTTMIPDAIAMEVTIESPVAESPIIESPAAPDVIANVFITETPLVAVVSTESVPNSEPSIPNNTDKPTETVLNLLTTQLESLQQKKKLVIDKMDKFLKSGDINNPKYLELSKKMTKINQLIGETSKFIVQILDKENEQLNLGMSSETD